MDGNLVCCLLVSRVFLCFFCFLVCKISPSRYERRGNFSIKDGSDWDAQARWIKLDIVICTTLPTVRLMIRTDAFRYSLHCFEIIVSFRTNEF